MYGADADWCQELAQRVEVHSSQSTVTLVAKVVNDPASQVPSEDVSSLTKGHLAVLEPEETWCGENLPEDLQITKARDDTGIMRNVLDDDYF